MSVGMMKKIFAAAVFAGAVSVTSASASTVNVTYQGSTVFGSPDLSQYTNVSSSGYSGGTLAGPFRLTGDNGFGNFVGFCIDLMKQMGSGNSYTTASSSLFGTAVDANIDRLFTSAYSGLTTAVQGAAFQLALWEIITDTGSGLSLTSGSFTATSNASVINQANGYLSGLSTASTGGYNITYLTSGSSQNLVTVSPVPVPAAAGMLGLGLASLFGLRRRKKA